MAKRREEIKEWSKVGFLPFPGPQFPEGTWNLIEVRPLEPGRGEEVAIHMSFFLPALCASSENMGGIRQDKKIPFQVNSCVKN